MSERTKIEASWIVAFDGRGHRLLKDGVVVYEGERILHVGTHFDGHVDRTVSAQDRVLTPGLISTHAHIAYNPLGKSLIEDRGQPQLYYSPLYEDFPIQVFSQDEGGDQACVEASMVELLRSGCTTVCELQTSLSSRPGIETVAREAMKVGMRAYLGTSFRSAHWSTPDGHTVAFRWDEEGGRSGLRRAREIIEQWEGAGDDTIRGMLAPAHSCDMSPELLEATRQLAEELRVPVTIHCSESVIEFQEMLRRHGKTPVEWLRDLDFLSPRVILGHAIHIGGTSWTNYPAGDLDIMRDTGVSISHSPWSFFRRGIMLESYASYARAGINISLGTDLTPQSAINALRFGACVGKAVERDNLAVTASHVFDAATLGGARALGRDDLGRIAPGAKADFVLWDARTLTMAPLRDPIRNIVYSAEPNDVETVIVNGRTVMQDRKVLGAEPDAVLAARLQAAGERLWKRIANFDRERRDDAGFSPLSYPAWQGP
ncbi:MAG: chlorohydrolase family protein [Vicinamibacterales bacterium]